MPTKVDTPVEVPSQTSTTTTDAPRPLTPEDLASAADITIDPGAPTAEPPGTASAATATAVGAWQLDRRITALWSNASTRNAWMHVAGTGWKRLHTANDSAFSALVLLASQARQTGCRIDYRDEADGLVHEITLW